MFYTISIDSGKGTTQYMGKNIETNKTIEGKFSSRYNEIIGKNEPMPIENHHIVKYDGERFMLGESCEFKDNDMSKCTPMHRLYAYTGICKVIEAGKIAKVNLAISCPINLYKDSDFKLKFAKYMKNEGMDINMIVDGNAYTFSIQKIIITCESLGFIHVPENKKYIENKSILSVDIGNLNLNFIGLKNGRVIPSTEETLNHAGYAKLQKDISNAFKDYNKGKPIHFMKINDAIDEEFISIANKKIEESEKIIKKIKRNFVRESISNIRSTTDLDDYDYIIFQGGTINPLRDYIYADNYVLLDDKQNVKGNFLCALKIFNDINN